MNATERVLRALKRVELNLGDAIAVVAEDDELLLACQDEARKLMDLLREVQKLGAAIERKQPGRA